MAPPLDENAARRHARFDRSLGSNHVHAVWIWLQEEAGHHEKAWAWRLSGALTFLLSPWWDA